MNTSHNSSLAAPANDDPKAGLAVYIASIVGAYSPKTLRILFDDFTRFDDWCEAHGFASAPADPDTLAIYVDHMARTYAPATVRRHLASIAHALKALGEEDATKAKAVRLAVRKMDRRLGTRQKQAAAITEKDVAEIINTTGNTLIDLRDVAMLLTARDLLARRSELVNITVEELSFHGERGATVLIPKSKTDPSGKGSVSWLSSQTVTLIKAWLKASGVTSGHLFRSVSKSGRVGRCLSGRDVARRFKVLAHRAGMNPDTISGHSCRVGMTQDLTAAGAELAELMIAGRWKSPQMPARYAERAVAERGAVAKYMRDTIGGPANAAIKQKT